MSKEIISAIIFMLIITPSTIFAQTDSVNVTLKEISPYQFKGDNGFSEDWYYYGTYLTNKGYQPILIDPSNFKMIDKNNIEFSPITGKHDSCYKQEPILLKPSELASIPLCFNGNLSEAKSLRLYDVNYNSFLQFDLNKGFQKELVDGKKVGELWTSEYLPKSIDNNVEISDSTISAIENSKVNFDKEFSLDVKTWKTFENKEFSFSFKYPEYFEDITIFHNKIPFIWEDTELTPDVKFRKNFDHRYDESKFWNGVSYSTYVLKGELFKPPLNEGDYESNVKYFHRYVLENNCKEMEVCQNTNADVRLTHTDDDSFYVVSKIDGKFENASTVIYYVDKSFMTPINENGDVFVLNLFVIDSVDYAYSWYEPVFSRMIESVRTNQINESSTGGGCLIATATFDSELAPQVQKLREIRDSKLLQTESGSQFMGSFNQFYYSFSPYIADYERENPVLKEMIKIGITPMLSTLSLMDYADTESEMLGIGISLIILNAMMYVGLPVFGIMIARKRF